LIEVHGQQIFSLSTAGGVGGAGPFSQASAGHYRYRSASWVWNDESDSTASLSLDRLNLKFELPNADVTVGRQAISLGKAYFWNPLDVFAAFGPSQFDRDYKGGVDALRVEVPVGAFSGVTLIGATGPHDAEEPFRQSAIVARAFTNVSQWDVAVQLGKIVGGYQAGTALSGDLDGLELRLEGAWFEPMENDLLEAHASLVLGTGWRFENSLHIQLEYFKNNAAKGPRILDFLKIGAGRLLHSNNNLLGLVATYEVHALVVGTLAGIWGMDDQSWLIQPGLMYSAADEVDVVAGALIARGSRPQGNFLNLRIRSEFGSYPDFYYLQMKIHF
jgi:hypothetical protein